MQITRLVFYLMVRTKSLNFAAVLLKGLLSDAANKDITELLFQAFEPPRKFWYFEKDLEGFRWSENGL